MDPGSRSGGASPAGPLAGMTADASNRLRRLDGFFQHPSRYCVELLEQLLIACRGRRDERSVEGAIRADGTSLVLGWKIPCQAANERLRLFGVGAEHGNDVADRDRV